MVRLVFFQMKPARPKGGGEVSERANATYGIPQDSVLSGYFLSHLCKNVRNVEFKGMWADAAYFIDRLRSRLCIVGYSLK